MENMGIPMIVDSLIRAGFGIRVAEGPARGKALRTMAMEMGVGTVLECAFRSQRLGPREIAGERVISASASVICRALMAESGVVILTSTGSDTAAHVTQELADVEAVRKATRQVSVDLEARLRQAVRR